MEQNVILITVDEVRPDHLSCYGYQRIKTENIDRIAEEGVMFDLCIASSCLTPICCGSILTGMHPSIHGMRDPFSYLQAKTLPQFFKKYGYTTAGFVGNGLLGTRSGFHTGFDMFDEPTEEKAWGKGKYPDPEHQEYLYEGNWWVDNMLNWLDLNYDKTFFIWGHYFETHEGAEKHLIKRGLIQEGVLTEFSYYDAKIKLLDDKLIGSTLDLLEKHGIMDKTTLIVMGDHGTTMGEHPAKPIPWRIGITYPQHTSLYDVDLRVPLMIKGKNFPKQRKVKGMVRSIDLVPTILESLKISEDHSFNGISLLPASESGESKGLVAYSEELYEIRGPGALQAMRTDQYKFIRNLSQWKEEFYDTSKDPGEQEDLISSLAQSEKEQVLSMRKKLNGFLWKSPLKKEMPELSHKDKLEIEARLRGLGYIK